MNFQQKEAIRQLRAEGQSYNKIADLLGISENTVKSYCRRNNLGGIAFTLTEPVEGTFCRQCGAQLKQILGKNLWVLFFLHPNRPILICLLAYFEGSYAFERRHIK